MYKTRKILSLVLVFAMLCALASFASAAPADGPDGEATPTALVTCPKCYAYAVSETGAKAYEYGKSFPHSKHMDTPIYEITYTITHCPGCGYYAQIPVSRELVTILCLGDPVEESYPLIP